MTCDKEDKDCEECSDRWNCPEYSFFQEPEEEESVMNYRKCPICGNDIEKCYHTAEDIAHFKKSSLQG